ncbi:hypothetical protein TNCT_588551 [Trichonephila clavata]|uniref:Uncharacterized protein n=1 Tax=Trichonephila clavata TaxID=2740835 RepID=A0A8X6H9T2_TRICU|nr:hypothetical protein TNCT_422651 [Trichonephila clavata]GFR18603.1 hypothetical protein TNCT_588551 [Trichonephila clavata]
MIVWVAYPSLKVRKQQIQQDFILFFIVRRYTVNPVDQRQGLKGIEPTVNLSSSVAKINEYMPKYDAHKVKQMFRRIKQCSLNYGSKYECRKGAAHTRNKGKKS